MLADCSFSPVCLHGLIIEDMIAPSGDNVIV
jgi:hypothetical protein